MDKFLPFSIYCALVRVRTKKFLYPHGNFFRFSINFRRLRARVTDIGKEQQRYRGVPRQNDERNGQNSPLKNQGYNEEKGGKEQLLPLKTQGKRKPYLF